MKDEIARQTNVHAGKQTLLYDRGDVETMVWRTGQIKDFPRTTLENPILLISPCEVGNGGDEEAGFERATRNGKKQLNWTSSTDKSKIYIYNVVTYIV